MVTFLNMVEKCRGDTMKKYLSIILGIILTACMVTCGSSDKDSVDNQDEEVISNQEVSDMMLFIWDIQFGGGLLLELYRHL